MRLSCPRDLRAAGAAGIRQTHRHARTWQGQLTSISVGNQVENGAEVYFGTGVIFLSPLSSEPAFRGGSLNTGRAGSGAAAPGAGLEAGDAASGWPGGVPFHLRSGVFFPSASPRDGCSSLLPRCPCQPAASWRRGEQSGGFPGMLSCRMSQQPAAQPGPAPAPSPSPSAKGSGHAAAGRGRSPAPGSHVAEPCPLPELQSAAGIRPHPRGAATGGVPGAGPCQAHTAQGCAGSARQPLGSGCWHSLRGRKQVGRKGGSLQLPEPLALPLPNREKGTPCCRERRGSWGDSVPHRGAEVGADPAGYPSCKCATRTRERFALPSPALGLWWGN